MIPVDQLLKDRVVTVYSSHAGERGTGFVMETCSLQEIGGRSFLVGKCAETGSTEWYTGMEAALPWDSVVSFFLMTREQFEKVRQAHRAPPGHSPP